MEENISEYDVGEIKPSLSILKATTLKIGTPRLLFWTEQSNLITPSPLYAMLEVSDQNHL